MIEMNKVAKSTISIINENHLILLGVANLAIISSCSLALFLSITSPTATSTALTFFPTFFAFINCVYLCLYNLEIRKTIKSLKRAFLNQDYSQISHKSHNQHINIIQSYINNILHRAEKQNRLFNKVIDRSERVKNKATKLNQLKSEFLANMSHELRTPLHAILGFSKISMKKIGAEENRVIVKHLETIFSSGNRLLNTVNAILDLSKLEAGKVEFEMSDSNILEITQELNRDFQSLLLDKQVEMKVNNRLFHEELIFDKEKISQVVQNLISNAIKFAPQGSTINITLEEEQIENIPNLKFSIEDSGQGIPEDELELIFDKFTQSTKHKAGSGGTGLGLCIAQEIIKAHNGQIWAENMDSGGAKFSFTIPLNLNVSEFQIIAEAI